MAYYLEEDKGSFLKISEEIFNTYKHTFDRFILENLDINADREFYDRILQLVHSQPDSWDFNEIISPILGIYPKECLVVLQHKILQSLEKERGRSSYRSIVSWIVLLRKIPAASEKAHEIIMMAYHHKPNLPALKDEMKRAG